MTAAQTELDRGNRPKLARVWVKLIAAHDRIFSEANKTALDHLVIKLSIAGYAIHLALIFLSRSLSHPPPLIAGLNRNYLAAINTPFSIILFYEALTLIAALPASTTRSIANQFEIVSLIFVRDVFKDIAKGAELVAGQRLTHEAVPVFIDMWAALLMFLLVAVFQYVSLQRVRLPATPEQLPALERFIAQKKLVTLGLATLLLAMAAYDLALFLIQTRMVLVTGHGPVPTMTFYKDLFTVMIFTDVLVLILSLVVSARYEMVFRNAAFVASITLIRLSLAQPNPHGALLALLAMIFGVLTVLVFNFHMRIQIASSKRS